LFPLEVTIEESVIDRIVELKLGPEKRIDAGRKDPFGPLYLRCEKNLSKP
jgi:hypothetical protein